MHSDTSYEVKTMKNERPASRNSTHLRVEEAYISEKPKIVARLRAAGRSLEEAEDLVHEVYTEIMERLPLLDEIRNLPALINSLITRRWIDLWRHEQVRSASGETDAAEEILNEVIAGAGFNPLEEYVRSCLVDALNDALRVLPASQRKVIEAQVFGGLTFREIAESTGESIDTLKARKRYAVQNLSRALRHWVSH
jgi:RNA polymerase sigma factor (sigma-70 family)